MPRTSIDGGLLTSQHKTIVIGIDPSLTGFAMTALAEDSDEFECWLYRSSHRGTDRLIDISLWMSMKIKELDRLGYTIADVAIEDAVVMSHSAVALGELHGVIKVALFHAMKRHPLRIPPTMVKKYATSKGNAKKNEVMLGIYKHWGVEFSDDNMADSYVIARMAACAPSTVYQKEIHQKLADPKFRDGV